MEAAQSCSYVAARASPRTSRWTSRNGSWRIRKTKCRDRRSRARSLRDVGSLRRLDSEGAERPERLPERAERPEREEDGEPAPERRDVYPGLLASRELLDRS